MIGGNSIGGASIGGTIYVPPVVYLPGSVCLLYALASTVVLDYEPVPCSNLTEGSEGGVCVAYSLVSTVTLDYEPVPCCH